MSAVIHLAWTPVAGSMRVAVAEDHRGSTCRQCLPSPASTSTDNTLLDLSLVSSPDYTFNQLHEMATNQVGMQINATASNLTAQINRAIANNELLDFDNEGDQIDDTNLGGRV